MGVTIRDPSESGSPPAPMDAKARLGCAAVLLVAGVILLSLGIAGVQKVRTELALRDLCADARAGTYVHAADRAIGEDRLAFEEEARERCGRALHEVNAKLDAAFEAAARAEQTRRDRESPEDRATDAALRGWLNEQGDARIAKAEMSGGTAVITIRSDRPVDADQACSSAWWFMRNFNATRRQDLARFGPSADVGVAVTGIEVLGANGTRLSWATDPADTSKISPYKAYCLPERP